MKKLLALFVLVAGCGGAPVLDLPDASLTIDAASPPDATPALDGGTSVAPTPPTFVSSTPGNGAISVAFADPIVVRFSTAMDAASTIAAIDIQPAISCTATVSADTYECAHLPLAPLTQYTVTVHSGAKSAAGLELADETTFSFTTAASSVDAVSVNGAVLREVRQSAGVTTLALVGAGLSTVTAATLGTLPMTIGAVTDTAMALSVTIPSATAPGDLPLVLTMPSGPITVEKAVTLSPISVATTGSDAAAGTKSAPFASIRKAISVAGPGDTVSLADGTYGANEAWPSNSAPVANVPDGLHLVGASQDGTILSPPAGASVAGLVFAGNADVTQLTLKGFARGIVVLSGTPGLGYVTVTQSTGDGIDVLSGTLILDHASVDHSGAAGISGQGTAFVSLDTVTTEYNATTGVSMSGTSTLYATSLLSTYNGTSSAKIHSGVYLTGAANATMTGGVTDNAAGGFVSDSTGSIFLDDISANGNGTASGCVWNWCSGIAFFGGSSNERASGVTVSQNKYGGIVVDGAPQVVNIQNATLTNNFVNLYANSNGAGSLHSNVNVTGSQLLEGGVGVLYAEYVALTVTGSTITRSVNEDIDSDTELGASTNAFIGCSFGTNGTIAEFPAQQGTVTIATNGANVGANQPKYTIGTPSAHGAPLVFTHP